MKTSAFFVFLVLLGPNRVQAGATCSCLESRINQISASSFGLTLLSPSFTSRYLNVSAEHGLVIKDPSEPIWFASNQYYWDQAYYKANGRSESGVCTYRISYYNRELRKVKYVNGDRPANITFSCHWYQECCDLGCCTSSVLQMVIYILLYVGIGLMLMGFCAQLPGESEQERRARRVRADAGLLFPCQRAPAPEPRPEEQALREVVHQEAPPKYDDLYPEGPAPEVTVTQPSPEEPSTSSSSSQLPPVPEE